MEESTTTNSLEANLSEEASHEGIAKQNSSSALDVSSPDSDTSLTENQTKEADTPEEQENQVYRRRRKLYQALARVEGSLKVKDDDIVLITKGDKTELHVIQITGKHTAMRLLKRPANRRQGVYSLYPQPHGVKIMNFLVDEKPAHPDVPPIDQMFISGKLHSKEADAFFVDIGRNRRTIKAKRRIELPLKIEGQEADPKWKIGQWIGLVLHRKGTKWLWQGDTRAVLKSGQYKEKTES